MYFIVFETIGYIHRTEVCKGIHRQSKHFCFGVGGGGGGVSILY